MSIFICYIQSKICIYSDVKICRYGCRYVKIRFKFPGKSDFSDLQFRTQKNWLDCEEFRKLEKSCDNIVMKNEKDQNKDFLDMRGKKKIPVKVYEALRSTGAQPARMYGLAKVHKKKPL